MHCITIGAQVLLNQGVYNLGDLTLANIHFENYKAFGTNGADGAISAVQSQLEFNEKDGYAVHVVDAMILPRL